MADATRGMLWELLYRASLHSAPAHPSVTACLRETLKLVLAGPCEPTVDLYRGITGKTDIMAYRPALRPGLVCQPMESAREGGSYVVKNPDEQRYLKLSKEDYFIFSHFNGSLTVREILTLYFMEFQALGHERVKGLIGELRSEHFLVEKPVTLFADLKKKLEKKTLSSSMHALAGIFFNRQLSVRGLDTTLSWLYKRIMWVFFSAPLVWLYPVLSVAGIALFLSLLFSGHYSLFKTAHSYSLGLVTLALIGIARITLHEGAHAFAVKACGREVHRGGFLFYFGVPSFFADTSDIWLGSKKERIMVSWAGPYAEIILSSLLTLLIVALPSLPANDFLFKIAFIGFLSAFLNLNPLLELDGYFILIDWLDLPRLRKRSLAFIKDSLLLKLKKSEPFSEQHKIFTLYGILSSLWTVIAVALSLVLLKMRMLTTLSEMFHSADIIARFLSAAAFLLFVAPLVFSLTAMLYVAVEKSVHFIARSRIYRDFRIIIPLYLAASLLVSFMGPFRGSGFVWTAVSSLLLGGGLTLVILTLRELEGSSLTDEFTLKGASILLLTVFALLGGFSSFPGRWGGTALEYARPITLFCAICCYFLYVYRFFLNFDQSLYGRLERLALGLALPFSILAVAAMDRFVFYQGDTLLNFFFSSIIGIGILACALLIPLLTNYRVTRFFAAFMMEAAALAFIIAFTALSALYLQRFHGDDAIWYLRSCGTLGICLLSGSALFYYLHLHWHSVMRPSQEPREAHDDGDRLLAAFRALSMSLLLNFRDTFGERRARKVERDFNDRAALCGWHMAIRLDTLEYDRGGADFQEMKKDCQHALAFLRDLVRDTAGTGLVQDIVIRVYDSLYWEEREVANSCLLAPFPWAHGFMRVSAAGEDARMCIASNPLFQGLPGEDMNALARIVRSRHYGPGQVIIREGERGEEFFLIRTGKVLVSARERGRETTLAELTSGDSFGERALLGDLVRTASVKALTDTDLLVMGREDFDRIMKERSGGAHMVDNAYHRQVDMLRRIPLFAELPVRQLQSLWSRLSLRKVKEGEVIVKKGEEGKEFFIIVNGEFTASTADDGADTVCGSPMKEGEYFGEIALLEEVPRTARVVACHDGELLVLEKDAFHSLLGYSPGVSRILSSTSRSRLQSDKKLLHGGKSR